MKKRTAVVNIYFQGYKKMYLKKYDCPVFLLLFNEFRILVNIVGEKLRSKRMDLKFHSLHYFLVKFLPLEASTVLSTFTLTKN